MATGKEMSKLEGHSQCVASVAISPDGKTIVSWSVDKTIR
jgi:WD40 repeat protein